MFNLWSSGPSTPKRSSTLKPTPLTPKLTTTTSPEYPPQLAHDTQWEHVKHGSPSSLDIEDEGSLERLGYSQVDGAEDPRGTPPASLRWQEERERLRQQAEASLTAQRKAENERDRWERKALELRTNIRSERERDKDGPSLKSRRERGREKEKDAASVEVMVDTLREENEKLKSMLQQQMQQLDAVQEETTRGRSQLESDSERLKAELDAARVAHKGEVEVLRMTLQEHAQRVEHLTLDRERVRKDRDSIRGSFNAEIERLKLMHAKEAEETKTALEELNRDRTQAHTDLRKARKSLDTYVPRLEESVREIEKLRSELSGVKESHRVAAELKQRLEVQDKELRRAREESSALKKEFNQLATLLEDRTSELKGAQSFLTTADAFSGAEVTSTLQRLNAEVLQSTAFMAESMVELFFLKTTPQTESKADERQAAGRRASAAVGSAIVHFLGTKKHTDDPILIQIAFQAYLAYHLRWIACSWIIGGDENHNRFIDAIYQSVHEKGKSYFSRSRLPDENTYTLSEAQAIAGRWRALTRVHVPSTTLDDSQIAFQIATKMISGLADLILATRCTAQKSDIGSALSSKFVEKLAFLVSLAMRVNKIIGEDVTSGDFEVLAIQPGTAFDVTSMEDAYDDGAVKRRGDNAPKVLCATDLGLRKKTRVGMTGEKQWEMMVLLKPKVALESVIDIMDE